MVAKATTVPASTASAAGKVSATSAAPSVSNEVATILLYKHIGNIDDMGDGINGAWVAEDIQNLNDNYKEQVKCINIRINSIGGSVADRLSIVSAILNSEIPCNTYIDGMAYFALERELLNEFVADGLLVMQGSRIEVQPVGRMMVRTMAMVFDRYNREKATGKFSKII